MIFLSAPSAFQDYFALQPPLSDTHAMSCSYRIERLLAFHHGINRYCLRFSKITCNLIAALLKTKNFSHQRSESGTARTRCWDLYQYNDFYLQLHQLLKHSSDPVLLSLEVNSDKASVMPLPSDHISHRRRISPLLLLRGEAIKNLSKLTYNF